MKVVTDVSNGVLPQVNTIETYGLASNCSQKLNGYIGVSVCSHFYSKRNVKAIIEWAANNFNEFLFLVADAPQAYTFMSARDLDYETSLQRAIKIGDERFSSIERAVENSGRGNIKVIRWKDVAENEKFLLTYGRIKECYDGDVNFKNDILAQIYLRNEHLSAEEEFSKIDKKNFDIAALYVLNEISVMLYLQEVALTKYPLQVYPFRMPPALVGLYANNYDTSIKLDRDKSGYIQIEVD